MNKKAVFFTIVAIAILSLFLVSYGILVSIDDSSKIKKRIKTMNNFIFSLEQDMSRQIFISSFRSILSLEGHILDNGKFLTDTELSIKEVILNGTIDGVNVSLMQGFRLEDWKSRVSEFGEKVNVDVNYTIIDVVVDQIDPWNVRINMVININIEDRAGLASWNRTQNITSKIEIANFEDPLYLINTNGFITNKFNKTIYTSFAQGTNVSNLNDHVLNSYYIASEDGPSFLDRLEGKTAANVDGNGIESLVYLPEISAQGISTFDKSVVDHIYFSTDNPSKNNILGMPSWFKLDNEHLSIYNVSHLVV